MRIWISSQERFSMRSVAFTLLLALQWSPAATFAPAVAPQRPAVRAQRATPTQLQLPEMPKMPDLPGIKLGGDEPAAAPIVDDSVKNQGPLPTPEAPGEPLDEAFWAPFSEMELAEQEAKLSALSQKWQKREEMESYADYQRSGFGRSSDIINGRTAMFFLVTGLVTEYYTGQSMPDQVYTMLQTLSIVG